MKVVAGSTSKLGNFGNVPMEVVGLHTNGSGGYVAQGAYIQRYVSLTGGAYEVPDPHYFDQHPYDEPSCRAYSRLLLNPVLHCKISGSVTASLVGCPETRQSGNWDILDKRWGVRTDHPLLIVPGEVSSVVTKFSVDNASGPTATRTYQTEVHCKCETYLTTNGRKAVVVYTCKLIFPVDLTGKEVKGRVAWSFDRWCWIYTGDYSRYLKSGRYFAKIGGGSFDIRSSSTTVQYDSNISIASVPGKVEQARRYMDVYLHETSFPFGNDTGGTSQAPGWLPYTTNESQLVQWARSLNPLSFLYGEVWRGLYSLNELSAEAISTIPAFEGNGIQAGRDLPMFAALCFSTAEKISRVALRLVSLGKSAYADSSARLIASAFLSNHFGIKLSLLDLQEMLDAYKKHPESAVKHAAAYRAGISRSGLWQARYQIYYTDFVIQDLTERLNALDVRLDAGNLWDLVPYSFIVDWFYNLGEVFNTMDMYNTLRRDYHCLGTVETLKITRTLGPDEITVPGGGSADLRFSYFRRKVGKQPAVPIADATSQPTLTNLVEGAAIVIARAAL